MEASSFENIDPDNFYFGAQNQSGYYSIEQFNQKCKETPSCCSIINYNIRCFNAICDSMFQTKIGFHLVQNRKENCHHNHIPFNFIGNENLVLSVYLTFVYL